LINKSGICLLALLLSSLVVADVFVRDDIITEPSHSKFSVCHNHTCQEVITLSINRTEWREISSPLQPSLATASDERAAIATTVANMETVVGKLAGTHTDKGGNLKGFGQPGQMDCIDESTNTTSYLNMLVEDGLLQHHSVADRSTRFGIIAGLPHTTAVIQENISGQLFAVDSWFFDNGKPPAIIEIQQWKAGWDPAGTTNE
jgi:hypothetical protein